MTNKNKISYILFAIIFSCCITSNIILAEETEQAPAEKIYNLNTTNDSIEAIATPAGYQMGETTTAYTVVGNLIQVALSFLGILFLILVIVSGFQWMMAEGNEDSVKKAKARIKNATIGLAVVVLAYALTYFILDILLSQTIK